MDSLHPPTALQPWTPELHASYVSQAQVVVDAHLAPAARPRQFRDKEQVDKFFCEVLGPSNLPVSDCSDKPKGQIVGEILASIIPNLFTAGYWCWESEADFVPVMDASQTAPVQRAFCQTDVDDQLGNETRSNSRAHESPLGSSISSGHTGQDSREFHAETSLGSVQFRPVLDGQEHTLNLKVTLTMSHQDQFDHGNCLQQIEQLKAENRALRHRIRDLEESSCAPDGSEGINRRTSSISTRGYRMNVDDKANAPRSSSWPLVPRAVENILGPQKTTHFPIGMAPSLSGAVSGAPTLGDRILRDASLLQRGRPNRFPPPAADIPNTMRQPKIENAPFPSIPSIKSEPGFAEAAESTNEPHNTGGLRPMPRDEHDNAGEKKRRRLKYDIDNAQHDNHVNDAKAASNAQDVFSTYDGRSLDRFSNDIIIPHESFGDVCTLIDGCKFIKAFGFIELRWVAPDNSCSSLKLRFPSKEVNINALYTPNNVNPHKRRDLNICLRKGKSAYESPWYWVPINWAKTLMRVDYFGPFLDKRSHVIIDLMARIAEMCDNAGQPLDQPQSSS